MRIKSIDIKNFRSYYGENNHFEFSDGLTLILGDNGDGKTTFFEALEWLFDTTSERANLSNVSEMRKSKLEIGEHDEVYVAMTFDHVQSAKPPVHLFKTKRFYFEVLFQNEASLLEQNQTAFKWTSNPI